MTITISGLANLPVVKVSKGNLVPLQLNFNGVAAYVIDPTAVYQNGTFKIIQSIFVDNGTNPNPVTVAVTGSNQTFNVPPYSGGSYPIAGTPISSISLTTNGGTTGPSNIQIYDYVVEPFAWTAFPTGTGNAVTIADGANATQGTKTDAVAGAPLTNAWSVVSLLKGILNGSLNAGNDGANVTQGSKADAIATTPFTNSWSVVSLLKGIANALISSGITVVGNVAAGTADSGNGVKVSGVYNTTLPTYTTGQRADLQLSNKGAVYTLVSNSAGTTVANVNSPSGDGAAASVGLSVLSQELLFNGATWDRAYSGPGSAAAGAGLGTRAVEESGRLYNNITTATTTTVKSGKGNLHTLTFNTPAAGTVTIYDNTAASGTKIGTITVVAGQAYTLIQDIAFATGLTLVTSVAMDITVSYR